MTVGIAAHGAAAGRAVLAGLTAVEAVGRGEIGGFGVFRAIAADGSMIAAETQRGGAAALRAALERNGLAALAEAAPVAALISSGPDRPEPLSQFLAAGPAGLVTGHRLPNTVGADGVPLNLAALRLLAEGAAPQAAVDAATGSNPEIDAGLIAVTPGAVAAAETLRVARRTDRGGARLVIRGGVAGVAVLHNAIEPFEGLAALAAGAARAILEAALPPLPTFRIAAGLRLEPGTGDGVWLDPDGTVLRVVSGNPGLANYRGWTSSAVYLGTPVHQHGRAAGVTVGEARCRLDRGLVVEVDPARPIVAWKPTAVG